MNGYNDDITNDQLAKLRQLFPEVFTEDKIDWARLKATLGEAVDLGERYGLGWKGKSDVFAKIQEKTIGIIPLIGIPRVICSSRATTWRR